MTYLADSQGRPFSLKECAKRSRLAQNTVKKILEALEGLFLIRRVSGFGFRTAPMFFLEDQGMASYLQSDKTANYMTRFIFSQVFPNIHYAHQNKYQIGYYENKSGLKVDLVARLEKSEIGFIYEDVETPSASMLRTAESFLADNKSAKVVLLTAASKGLKLDENMIQLPWSWII